MRRALLAFVTLAVPLVASSAWAEAFVSVRAGAAFTRDDGGPRAERLTTSGDFDFDDSGTGAVRGGYWFDRFDYLGVALDLSAFAPHVDRVTTDRKSVV